MGEIIEVDFNKKIKVANYTIVAWKCFVCRTAYKSDSREVERNMPRIILREGTNNRAEEAICKNCCLDIKNTTESLKWEYDE